MSEVLSFDEAVGLMRGGWYNCYNLLFGNGASIDWSLGRMSYSKLYEASGLESDIKMDQLFRLAGSENFEEVLKILQISEQVTHLLGMKDTSGVVKCAEEKIIKSFLSAIYSSHEDRDDIWPVRSPSENECEVCNEFLSNFEQVFTLNYDLLPSSVLAHGARESQNKKSLKDGFTTKRTEGNYFNKSCGCNFWYLHGGLHIYNNASGVYKLVKSKDLRLHAKVSGKLKNGDSPVIVCGGSGETKRRVILSNSYLSMAFMHFQKIKGPLMIYGHSLSIYDNHIYEAINESKTIGDIFYCDVNADTNKERLTVLLKDRFPQKQAHVVSAETVPFWRICNKK